MYVWRLKCPDCKHIWYEQALSLASEYMGSVVCPACGLWDRAKIFRPKAFMVVS